MRMAKVERREWSLSWPAGLLIVLSLCAAHSTRVLAEQQAVERNHHHHHHHHEPSQQQQQQSSQHFESNQHEQGSGTHEAPAATWASNELKHQQHQTGKQTKKCTRQSMLLARQMLVHELNHINNFNPMWFNDLDRDELIEGQKHSLSNIVMSGFGTRLLHPDGQPLIEIESSYFRGQSTSTNANFNHHYHNASNAAAARQQPLTIKLIRRHQDRCQLSADKSQFQYAIGLSVGPIEHHLDVLYNLPKDLSLSQPLDWRYGQITIHVPKMIYEVSLKQMAHYKLNSVSPFGSNCPLDIGELLYLPPTSNTTNKSQATITSSGLALNNQTLLQVERLFDDYTRPIVSRRLRQMLKFYLNTKTLPLSSACNDC